MALKEELYISINPNTYRENKSNILSSQADLLNTLKRLHNLKILLKQKHDFKKKLHQILSSSLSELNLMKEKMPSPKLPKVVQKEEKKPEVKETFSRRNDIEDELKLIQEKLRELNS